MTVLQALVPLNNMLLKCCRCQKEKVTTEFKKCSRNARGYIYACKDCEKLRKEIKIKEIYTEIYFYLTENKCVKCGEDNPLKLEFDHIDKTTKKYTISNMCTKDYSLDTIWKEIKKCQILCSNCHREKTHKEQNTIPYQIHKECNG